MTQRPPEPTSSSRRWRRIMGIVAVAAGIVLILLERGVFTGAREGGSCFWLVVAALLIILGIVQLLDRGTPRISDGR